MTFSVTNLSASIVRKPSRIIIYAANGCGKSTLCAPTIYGDGADNPIYMNINNGISTLRVAGNNIVIKAYEHVLQFLDSVLKDEHTFRTLVIDSADDLETLIFEQIAMEHSVKNIADIGYNKGYDHALSKWKDFQERLDTISRRRNMDIVILAQCDIKKFNDPMGTAYDIYTPKLHGATQKGATSRELLKGWADAVLLMKREVLTKQDDSMIQSNKSPVKRKVACSDGIFLYTTPTGAFDAKNRYNLPEKIDVSHNGWVTLKKYIDDFWEEMGGSHQNEKSQVIPMIAGNKLNNNEPIIITD